MEDAPMANKHVQFALRDAQYTTLGESRAQLERGFALRAKLTTDKATLSTLRWLLHGEHLWGHQLQRRRLATQDPAY